MIVDETVSIQSDSDSSSKFSFVGYPTMIDEISQRCFSSSAGVDQFVEGEAPEDDLKEWLWCHIDWKLIIPYYNA